MSDTALTYAVASHLIERHGGYAEVAWDVAEDLVATYKALTPRDLFVAIAESEEIAQQLNDRNELAASQRRSKP